MQETRGPFVRSGLEHLSSNPILRGGWRMVWLGGKRKTWGVILGQPEGAKERAVGTQAGGKF